MATVDLQTQAQALADNLAKSATQSAQTTQSQPFSKKLIADIRALLWVVTLGGLVLATGCVYRGFTGSLPWLTAMVGLPWTAHGVVCTAYLNMAKSDHSEGGITYEAAKAQNFDQGSVNSPAI